jgi:hypothetical protein
MFRLYGRPDRSVKWKFCYYMTRLDFSIIVHGLQKWPFPKAPPSRESSLFLFTLEAQKKRANAGVRSVGETVTALCTFRSELLFSNLALYTELL